MCLVKLETMTERLPDSQLSDPFRHSKAIEHIAAGTFGTAGCGRSLFVCVKYYGGHPGQHAVDKRPVIPSRLYQAMQLTEVHC